MKGVPTDAGLRESRANETANGFLRNDILVEELSFRRVRFTGCNCLSATQGRAVCEQAAAVSALSGKMIHGTLRFCARGANHKWT